VRRIPRKLLFYFIAIWTISAAYAVIANRREAARIRFDDGPGVLERVWESINPSGDPKIKSKSAILVDLDTGDILAKKNEGRTRPIASLTKLVTTMVFLRTEPDLFRVVTVTSDDRLGAGKSRLYVGEELTLFDLLHLTLISSDNVAARILARSTGFSGQEFVEGMNRLAGELNLDKTRFSDPTGLDRGNVSTASEFAVILKAALEYGRIARAIAKKNHTYTALNSKEQFIAYNTNRLLYGREDILGGKTGYIRDSGYCLALGVETLEGRRLGAVLLGAPSNNYRYRDAHRLLAAAHD
jgi:D-alanyl-D-alanine endopeptidase (penicillin-binding protein 7)